MDARSSLSQDQRVAAVALFEEGSDRDAFATQLGVSRDPVNALYDRWRVRGTGALVTKPDKETYAFEVKLDVVQRFLAGDPKVELAQEFGLSSPQLIGSWVRKYRDEGDDKPFTRRELIEQTMESVAGERTGELSGVMRNHGTGGSVKMRFRV